MKKVEQQALLYINILGSGNDGQNTLADSKRHKALKPNWLPSSVAFDGPDAYTNPTKASLEKNEDVIESILKYFKYDPRTHCEYPDIPASKPGGRPKTQNKRVNENEKDANQSRAKKSKQNVQGSFMEDNSVEAEPLEFQIPVRQARF